MKLNFIKTKKEKERIIKDVSFKKYKFNNRIKPENKKDIKIFSCFSEFGCETLGVLYCMPHILKNTPGKYTIAVGWYGREYLYRHLVDEFWEISKENQWLREYCKAFHHDSKNLKNVENMLLESGSVITARSMGQLSVGNRCYECGSFWGDTNKVEECKECKSKNILGSILGNVDTWKPQMKKLPSPSIVKLQEAAEYLGKNPVGIFARGRKCYGRNLQPEFYVKLIALLRDMGYSPIWLGEEASTQPCPVKDVVDFSRKKESQDLELTLAIIKQCRFTVQYWTASTRLAGMMGVPYLLFESPDQIWGRGQEGMRRNLCDVGESKLSVNHFLSVYQNNDEGIKITKRCIQEMEAGDYKEVYGLLETDNIAKLMKNENSERIGDKWK